MVQLSVHMFFQQNVTKQKEKQFDSKFRDSYIDKMCILMERKCDDVNIRC